MKVQITLHGRGGELDKQTIAVNDDDPSEQIHEAMKAWIIGPGDTIIINQLEEEDA